MVCTLIMNIGFCMIAGAFSSDIEGNLRFLNNEFLNLNYEKFKIDKQVQIMENFYDIVRFYSEGKELSNVLCFENLSYLANHN